jgi:hypothetical protein
MTRNAIVGAGGCFLGHTLIRTPDGQRAIETLQPGDLVLSFDDAGQLYQGKILKVHVHEGERVVRYRLWGGTVLDATPNHWVLNQFNAFVEIDTLGPDDCLVDENGHLRPIVDRSEFCVGTVYNLTVQGHHTFIAGGIRVHNAGLGLGTIAGAGGSSKGGGGGGGTPTEAEDNLNSTQYATVLDLISEGEIEGLKDGDKSIYLDDTPLQNPDGSYNFEDVTVSTRTGTQSQAWLSGAKQVENEIAVNVTVEKGTPVTRTITSTEVDAVKITITVPALQIFQDDGDIVGSSFKLNVQVQYNGGGYSIVYEREISGRSGDQFQRDFKIDLNGQFPVDIRVVRTTANSDSTKKQNSFIWSSYTEITYGKLRYPNSALVLLEVEAEQFSTIPRRAYLVRGIKVKLPSNATVDSTTGRVLYSGVWNGVFGAAQWCSDPAWILWDLLTSTRYGFGDHIKEAQLDKWSFYAASQYCSQLVPNGYGGYEPRFSCNVNIQTDDDAYKLINDMCSVFRVMPYWSTGSLTLSQDRPSDPAYLFTYANVSEGGFTYQGSSLKNRPTVAVVSYLNLDTRETDYESVEDSALISKYGVVKKEVSAFACTSRGQARRLGEWLLYTDWYESEVVSFTASIDAGVMVRPGQIIEISDPLRAGTRRGGRIVSATTTAVTVDDASSLALAVGAQISVILSNGTIQSRAVTAITGSVVSVSAPFSSAPNPNSVWVYQTSDLRTSTWRVLTVQEQDGVTYAITALAYNSSKYNYVERDLPLQQRDVTNLNVIPAPPKNLQAIEAIYENNGRALSKLVLSWQAVSGINQYRIRWRPQEGNWTTSTQTRLDYEILDTKPGRYDIEVYSLNAALRPSATPATLTVSAFGKTAPPVTPTGLSLIPIDEASAIISWDRSTELDVLLGGKVLIRHNVAMVGALWETSQEIVAAAAGSQTQKQVPLLEGTYLIKFEDDGGRRSDIAATIVVDLPTPQPRLLVQTYAEELESPPFNGNYTDMFYVSSLAAIGGGSGIILSTGTAVDSMALDGNWDALISIDGVGGVLATGQYEFGSTYSFPGVFDVNLRRRLVTVPYLPGDLIDDKLDLIDTWGLLDGTAVDRVNALTYVRATQDDPSGTPTWGDWREFSNAIVRGRGFQFKTIATSDDPTQNIVIEELGTEMELQQRVEQSATLTSGTGTYSVVFASPFFDAPSVGITAYNMGTGDYFTVASVTRTGFQVTFRNAAASAVSRQFTYTAVGYGREI